MTKINQLIKEWPKGTIKTSKELRRLGYSSQLLKIYSNSKWIESFVHGMFKLYNDQVSWAGVLYGLQNERSRILHVGGKTALVLKGYGHYLGLNNEKIYLFSDRTENFNAWLKKFENVTLKRNEVFGYKADNYFIDYDTGNFKIKIASPELASMEMLYLVPNEHTFDEAAKIMEGLVTLRPAVVQEILQNCKSIKVNRLFLFIAEYHNHPWIKELNVEKINIGKGKRVIVEEGIFNKRYKITVPKEYAK